MATDLRIGTAPLSSYHHQLLLLWAFCDRKTKGMLGKDILVARSESNKQLIDDKLLHFARAYGLTVEELIERIVQADANNQPLSTLQDELEKSSEVPPKT